MLFSLLLIPILWRLVLVECDEVASARKPNSTVLKEIFGKKVVGVDDLSRRNFTADEKRKSDALGDMFRKKYAGKGYTKWQKLHDAQSANLTKVCYDDAMVMFSNPNLTLTITAEGKASFRSSYYVVGVNKIEVDTLVCAVKFLAEEGKEAVKLEYYFCEADEPDSAFRFTLAQKSFILTNKVHNFWSDHIPNLGKYRASVVRTTRF